MCIRDSGVTELPFIPHLKVIGRFGSQRKQFHRIVVGIIIGCEAHGFDSLAVQTVGTPELGRRELGGIERIVESCHSLVGKLLRSPHVFTCDWSSGATSRISMQEVAARAIVKIINIFFISDSVF